MSLGVYSLRLAENEKVEADHEIGDWQLPSQKTGAGRIAMKGCCRYAAPTCGWNEERDGLGAATGLIDQEQMTT